MKKITYLIGDTTQCKPMDYNENNVNGEYTGSGMCYIPHVCNDIGMWGAGFVLAITNKLGSNPEDLYRKSSRNVEHFLEQGNIQIATTSKPYVHVVNMIAQKDTSYFDSIPPIRYGSVRRGLRKMVESEDFQTNLKRSNVSVHMPRIGCGLAGGRWEKIEKIIIEELCEKDIDVFVYDLK